jgi:hypothetical protein
MKVSATANPSVLVSGVGLGTAAGGDVSGPLPGGLVVTGIQGVPVDPAAATPADRDTLIFDSGAGWWTVGHQQATDVDYDPTASGLTSVQVQAAIDELAALIAAITVSGVLDDLTDVVITSPATLDRLHYDGTNWINTAAIWRPLMDGGGAVVTDGGTGEAIMVLS